MCHSYNFKYTVFFTLNNSNNDMFVFFVREVQKLNTEDKEYNAATSRMHYYQPSLKKSLLA